MDTNESVYVKVVHDAYGVRFSTFAKLFNIPFWHVYKCKRMVVLVLLRVH